MGTLSILLMHQLIIFLDVISDAYRADILFIDINHFIDTAQVSIIYILITLTIGWYFNVSNMDILCSLILLVPMRWIEHDLLLNIMRGKDLLYLGKGENASVLDKWLAKRENLTQITIKGILLLVCVLVVIYIKLNF